jgi:hypothetical protein
MLFFLKINKLFIKYDFFFVAIEPVEPLSELVNRLDFLNYGL